MRDAAVRAEAVAFIGVLPGFLTLMVLVLVRRPLYRLERDLHRLPLARFHDAIMLPVISVAAGAIAGVGSNLVTGDSRLGWAALLLIGAGMGCVVWASRLALRPARPGVAGTFYRRQVLARLIEYDWAAASAIERETATRTARRLAATGRRLAYRGRTLRLRRWLPSRNRWLLAWLAVATLYATGFLIWVVIGHIVERDRSTPGWGALLMLVTPMLGPGQLWLWCRLDRATLCDFGAELEADAGRVLAAIAGAPRLTLGRRLIRALRVLVDGAGTSSAVRPFRHQDY